MTLSSGEFETTSRLDKFAFRQITLWALLVLITAFWSVLVSANDSRYALLLLGCHIGFGFTCNILILVHATLRREKPLFSLAGLLLSLFLLSLSLNTSFLGMVFHSVELDHMLSYAFALIAFAVSSHLMVSSKDQEGGFNYRNATIPLGFFAGLFFLGINSLISPLPSITNLHIVNWLFVTLTIIACRNAICGDNSETGPSFEPETDIDDMQQELAAQNLELQMTLRELQERNQELEKLNTLDALSGIHNRRHFDKRLQAELRRARRELTPMTLIMFDVDHFKAVNDTYGHQTGDEVIRTVAHTAAELLNRSADEAFRYGGEEFALILPNTEKEGALMLAEKVRHAIANCRIASTSGQVSCTVSLGVAVTDATRPVTPAEFIEMADSALYKAKQSGRNQVILFSPEE